MLEFFNKLGVETEIYFTFGLFGSKLGSVPHRIKVPVDMKKKLSMWMVRIM
jgi:hypothetical protein